ncbi:hypothetical protein A0257_22125 [Hymenobacter psoromatis]|nr:hypothetical protein A0257_22125 [Hymenobacter psoromatis]
MIINDYNPAHKGTQPIRVLQFNLTDRFENTNPDFAEQTRQLMSSLDFQPGITYHCNELPIRTIADGHFGQTPYITGSQTIHIHETFLSYVWCVTYSLVTLYEEAVAKPSQNQVTGQNLHIPNQQLIRQANALMAYAQGLMDTFEPWDKNLPNPEQYEATAADWIRKINGVYLYAINFILVHEFMHAKQQHVAQLGEAKMRGITEDKLYALQRDFEREADQLAIKALQQGHLLKDAEVTPSSNKISSELGNLVGLCSLLFFSRSVNTSRSHPGVAERIDAFMQETSPEPQSGLWGLACVAFKLWAANFGLIQQLPDAIDGYEQLYVLMRDAARQLP